MLLQASLLVVDNKLLLQVAEEVIGAPLDRSDSPEAGSFSISAFLLSLWLSGAAQDWQAACESGPDHAGVMYTQSVCC